MRTYIKVYIPYLSMYRARKTVLIKGINDGISRTVRLDSFYLTIQHLSGSNNCSIGCSVSRILYHIIEIITGAGWDLRAEELRRITWESLSGRAVPNKFTLWCAVERKTKILLNFCSLLKKPWEKYWFNRMNGIYIYVGSWQNDQILC